MSERFLNYNPPISGETRALYEQALSREFRWKSDFLEPLKDENDLDHVKGMFRLHDLISWKHKALFDEVDSPETEHMIYLHDAGEIIAHDLPHATPNYDNLRPRRKRMERAAVRLLTRKYIEDVELRTYIRRLYDRYERRNPQDLTAQYVNYLDKIQATRFGATNVFHASRMRTKALRQQQVNHVYGLHIKPAVNLFSLLTKDAQDEFLDFADNELAMLKQNGYASKEVDPYRELMREALLSQREVVPK